MPTIVQERATTCNFTIFTDFSALAFHLKTLNLVVFQAEASWNDGIAMAA